MRRIVVSALVGLAACSGGGGEESSNKIDRASIRLEPGEWELTNEITNITLADQGTAAVPMKVGMRTTTKSCITPEQVEQPQPTIFASSKDTCTYKNFYMSRGRLVASMSCKQPGLDGEMLMTVEGDYTNTSMDVTVEMATSLVGPGDVKVNSKISGRRLGECPAATEEATAEPATT
jgi:hypothetical protein